MKKNSKKNIKELSSTGGGAAPGQGATTIPGSGEGVATKYAFGKKKKSKKPNFISKIKNEARMIFWETLRGL